MRGRFGRFLIGVCGIRGRRSEIPRSVLALPTSLTWSDGLQSSHLKGSITNDHMALPLFHWSQCLAITLLCFQDVSYETFQYLTSRHATS